MARTPGYNKSELALPGSVKKSNAGGMRPIIVPIIPKNNNNNNNK
jgi:hypothetical protein